MSKTMNKSMDKSDFIMICFGILVFLTLWIFLGNKKPMPIPATSQPKVNNVIPLTPCTGNKCA